MAEKLSPAQQRAVDWIQNKSAAELGSIGTEIGKMLAELTVELADAKREAAHWKQSFEIVRREMVIAIAVAIKQFKATKLIVPKSVALLCEGKELFTMYDPTENAYVFELREKKAKVDDVVRDLIRH